MVTSESTASPTSAESGAVKTAVAYRWFILALLAIGAVFAFVDRTNRLTYVNRAGRDLVMPLLRLSRRGVDDEPVGPRRRDTGVERRDELAAGRADVEPGEGQRVGAQPQPVHLIELGQAVVDPAHGCLRMVPQRLFAHHRDVEHPVERR